MGHICFYCLIVGLVVQGSKFILFMVWWQASAMKRARALLGTVLEKVSCLLRWGNVCVVSFRKRGNLNSGSFTSITVKCCCQVFVNKVLVFFWVLLPVMLRLKHRSDKLFNYLICKVDFKAHIEAIQVHIFRCLHWTFQQTAALVLQSPGTCKTCFNKIYSVSLWFLSCMKQSDMMWNWCLTGTHTSDMKDLWPLSHFWKKVRTEKMFLQLS